MRKTELDRFDCPFCGNIVFELRGVVESMTCPVCSEGQVTKNILK